ncbi:MAG: cell division protein FtsZ [Betaproteobacteria bacterium]|nr:cell division protein FtsZ [Betaproteobacteria bacterium]
MLEPMPSAESLLREASFDTPSMQSSASMPSPVEEPSGFAQVHQPSSDAAPFEHRSGPSEASTQPMVSAIEIDTRPWSDGPAELPTLEKPPALDALIDVIAPIELDSPTSGDAALAVAPTTARVGSKFFTIEGLNVQTGEWLPLRLGQRYSAFQAGMQLANRTGALNEIEYSEFVMKVQTFADATNGQVEFPDMLEAVARARELDQFASAHDAQLSFTLRATRAAWSPGYVQQNAARLGFIPGVIPGRMVLPAPVVGASPIVVLSFDPQAAMAEDPAQSAVREINLSLDVPHVVRTEEPFARLCHAARELAKAMDGTITDDHGQALSDAAIRAIDTDLRTLYNTLDARDLSAGSPQARRLFS